MIFDEFVAYHVAGATPGDFKKLGPPYQLPVNKYDINSVMHYAYKTATIDGKAYAYFRPKKPKLNSATFGTQGVLSPGDIKTVKALYP